MTKQSAVTATAADMVRRFSYFNDVALSRPVTITKNGRARTMLISADEYKRLKKRNQSAVMAADIPDAFLPQLEALARGKK